MDDGVGFLTVPGKAEFWVKVDCRPEGVKSNSEKVWLRCCGPLMEVES